jgi:hypothetical protein
MKLKSKDRNICVIILHIILIITNALSLKVHETEKIKRQEENILPIPVNLNINVDIVELVKNCVELGQKTINNILYIINNTLGSYEDKIKDEKPTENSRFISIMTEDELVAFYYHEYKDHIAYAEGSMNGYSCGKAGEWARVKVTRESKATTCTLYRSINLIKHGKAVCNISYFSSDPYNYKCTCKENTKRDLNANDKNTRSCSDINLDNDAFAFYDIDGNLIYTDSDSTYNDNSYFDNDLENENENTDSNKKSPWLWIGIGIGIFILIIIIIIIICCCKH